MWSEDLDKKLQNAAGSNEPAYNDKAWEKMESLLDKHLPPEKKRRPIILFLFLFLFGGALIYMIWPGKGGSNDDNRTSAEKTSTIKQELTPQQNIPIDEESSNETERKSAIDLKTPRDNSSTDISTNDKIEPAVKPDPSVSVQETGAPKNTPSVSNTREDQKVSRAREKLELPRQPVRQQAIVTGKRAREKQDRSKEEASISKNVPNNLEEPIITGVEPDKKNNNTDAIVSQPAPVKTDPIAPDPAKDPSLAVKKPEAVAIPRDSSGKAADVVDSKLTKKPKQRKGNQLAFLFSFGPDISGVGVDNPGKWNLQYGIGLSYPINDRLSVRAGFYAARKIYKADSADYHAPKYWPNYYPNLKTVDANCMVYEIPISLVYSFKPSGKHNWFASAGIASHIMKRETYGYHFKNAWGQDDFYSHTYKNESSHLFSALSLSGGYQYKFSNRFSLMVEPYVKLPISGIGLGSIRLTSAGLMITAALKPFAK